MRQALYIIIGIVVFGLVRYGVRTAMTPDKPVVSPYALKVSKQNMFKSAFVDGCIREGGDYGLCSCLYNQLDNMYSDFSTNESRLNRITVHGYTTTETDALVVCLPDSV